MHFRSSPKADLNSNLLTYCSAKMSGWPLPRETRGDTRSGAARPSVGKFGGTISKILIGIQWDVWQRWDTINY